MSGGAGSGPGPDPRSDQRGELRVVGTSVTREVELLLDRVAQTVGRRSPPDPASGFSPVGF